MKKLAKTFKVGTLVGFGIIGLFFGTMPVIAEEQPETQGAVATSMENQPESSYWFPDELLEWSFAKDADAKYREIAVDTDEYLIKVFDLDTFVDSLADDVELDLEDLNINIYGCKQRKK